MSTCTHPHVLVTGASTGIGRATALHLAARGDHVYAGVRRPTDGAALEKAAAHANSSGVLTPVLLDVTDPTHISAAVDTITAHVGAAGIDGLVNNAGIGLFGPLELTGVETFRRLLEINVTGQLALTQAFLPLLRQAQGRIVMIGSIGARFTPPYVGPLAASKSALASMSEALRQELAPWNIRVVLVEPASVRSDAVDKLRHDTTELLDRATPEGRALYQESFGRMVASFSAQHEKGSAPEIVARTVAHALTTPRPRARYLTAKNSLRMAFMAAVLPTPAQDAVRRRIADQPAPGSRVGVPRAVHAVAGR